MKLQVKSQLAGYNLKRYKEDKVMHKQLLLVPTNSGIATPGCVHKLVYFTR